MVRIGIVGCNYGRVVQIPAFRLDPRCTIQAIAATDLARAAEVAKSCEVPLSFGNWRALVEHDSVDAVVVATPPTVQPEIAIHVLSLSKPVLIEKPMAVDSDGARAMLEAARKSNRPAMIDFNFSEILCWRRARQMLQEGAIGALRHVFVTWNVENYATRARSGWKFQTAQGGGALSNFVCHCFHYLEWFCGPIIGLSARLATLAGNPNFDETTVAMPFTFESGAAGGLCMSSASYLGSGHRLEFYGEEGTLVLVNETSDYMRGFRLLYGKRPATALEEIPIDDELSNSFADGRVAPTSRIAARFLDAIENASDAYPDFTAGYRVQCLMDAARVSHETGRWTETRQSNQ